MTTSHCPYCKASGMTPPANLSGQSLYGFCHNCRRSSRAKITRDKDGRVTITYSATKKPRADRRKVKTHHKQIRLSDDDLDALKSGAAYITVNKRDGLKIVYKE